MLKFKIMTMELVGTRLFFHRVEYKEFGCAGEFGGQPEEITVILPVRLYSNVQKTQKAKK